VNELLGGNLQVEEGQDYLAVNSRASQCEWKLGNGSLYVEVLGGGAASWFDAVNFGNTNPPVEGIGDKAIWGPAGTLDVLDGDYMVSVQLVIFLSDVDQEAATKAVAERVLSKLP